MVVADIPVCQMNRQTGMSAPPSLHYRGCFAERSSESALHIGSHRVRGEARLYFPICARGPFSVDFSATLTALAGGRLAGGHMGRPRFVASHVRCE